MTDMLTPADIVVPEMGQVVRCRDRVWAVNEAPSLPFTLDQLS